MGVGDLLHEREPETGAALYEIEADPAERARVTAIIRAGYERLNGFVGRGLEYFDWLAGECERRESSAFRVRRRRNDTSRRVHRMRPLTTFRMERAPLHCARSDPLRDRAVAQNREIGMSVGNDGSTRQRVVTVATLAGVMSMLAAPAAAHVGHGPTSGFGAGLIHPLAGLDHVLATVAVGLWAARQRGHAVWAVPASFVATMVLGALVGLAGVRVPMTEQVILLSVAVMSALVASGARPPVVVAVLVPAVFALIHGHAHGVEMPPGATAAFFVAGFVTATLALQASGFALAAALRHGRPRGARTLVRQRDFT